MRVMILAALTMLAACGHSAPDTTYPPQFELNFMRACQAQGTTAAFCSCTWDRIEAEVAPADFAEFERLAPTEQASHPLQQQIEEFALACAPQTQAPDEDPPAP
jgi:hypothetical protein